MEIIIKVLTNCYKFGLHGLNLCGVAEKYMCKLIVRCILINIYHIFNCYTEKKHI